MSNGDICLSFTGSINDASATRIAATFNAAINDGHNDILFAFNSNGGTISEGLFLHNYLKGLPATITAHCIGEIASIGVVVFIAAANRLCAQSGRFIIHPSMIPVNAGNFTAESLAGTLNTARDADSRIRAVYEASKLLPTELLDRAVNTEVVIEPTDALAWGLIHEIKEFALPPGKKLIQI